MKKTTKMAKRYFMRVTKLLEKDPAKKKELAEYLTRELGDGKRQYRVGEISRWLTAESRTEFSWAIGYCVLQWFRDQTNRKINQKK